MASKNNDQRISSGSLPALRIGSRVRCTDDRVEGRIVWANAVSVKIRWNDGEQVTWRRDSLVGRPIEILDAADDANQHETTATSPTVRPADDIGVSLRTSRLLPGLFLCGRQPGEYPVTTDQHAPTTADVAQLPAPAGAVQHR